MNLDIKLIDAQTSNNVSPEFEVLIYNRKMTISNYNKNHAAGFYNLLNNFKSCTIYKPYNLFYDTSMLGFLENKNICLDIFRMVNMLYR